jgi:hypothetical protein
VVVYLIHGILYESYIHPITILSTLPSAGVGALAILILFHYDFSLIALIGMILLIGIAKKNGILLVDFAMVAERDDHLSTHDAIRRAALLRFRPIMMTTLAAMLGGVPLMLGHGTGAEIRQPLGYAMAGRPDRQPRSDAVHNAGDLSTWTNCRIGLRAGDWQRPRTSYQRPRYVLCGRSSFRSIRFPLAGGIVERSTGPPESERL